MLTPAKHRNWIRACFVLEQSRAPGSNAVRWAPYASRWTLVFQHPYTMKLSLSFAPIKTKEMSQALGVTYSLNPLLQISAFLSCWCALCWGLKTHHVSLLEALCFKTLSSLLPEAVDQNCGLLKNCSNTEAVECQEMCPCLWNKAPSLSHHPSYANLEGICFLCPSQPFNCASLQETPALIHPWAPVFVWGKSSTVAWLLLSHVGFVWHKSDGAISPSPIQHEMCCSWPGSSSSQPTFFNSAWARTGEEFTFF